ASLAERSARAAAHWMALEGRGALLPVHGPAALGEIKAAFEKYRATVSTGLLGLPGLLELAGRIKPLTINLMDAQQTVQLSYRGGLKVLDRSAPFHISMTSSNVVFLFKNEDGCDTTYVNGRFRSASPAAFLLFTRFFLPQRMVRNGYDKGRPMLTLAYLARTMAGRVTRQMQGVLRRLARTA
ncbi:MAG TPA: hypothetical protein VF861_02870, partial [Telluria sp.]